MELLKDERGVFTEVVGIVIVGAIVTYILVIFMGAFFPTLNAAIDASAGGVAQAAAVKLFIRLLTFFVVMGLIMKVWNTVSGGGSSPYQN